MEVLYCDNHILVAVKPFNMPSQSDSSGDGDMLTAMKKYVGIKYNKPGNVYLGLVHRLDRPAGGVMVFARTSKAAARLSAQFAAHSQGRKYLAVVRGEMRGDRRLVDYLAKGGDGMVRIVGESAPGAKRAELVTRPVAVRGGLTLTDVELFTGRAHQIRVQHAGAGHPLWGDARYGGGKPGEQLALWAYRLSIKHPTRDEVMSFSARPPRCGAWLEFDDVIDERMADE
jgi:23S rRNA pseudouridine1911/1915/1917 synthase